MTVSFLIWCVGATEIRFGVKKGEIEARGREIMVLNTTRNKKGRADKREEVTKRKMNNLHLHANSACKLLFLFLSNFKWFGV